MSDYYYFNINVDRNGKHEVHSENCSYLPNTANRKYIGLVSDCKQAMIKAKADNPSKEFDGCYYCCNACHTG
ncbi:hypothetical protein [Halolactibacillus sp. JCM 19043]|uniref:hypothetical protein n=1 Tax=Halolactibacillus sp. JCM 19043 TaxID=1460638 RepID=UPI0007828FF0|nr:hypothetical protein [Halolactibacillus sp. JCM 19043]